MLRRPYRTILRREQDADGAVTWIAEVADMPWCRGVGTTRLQALRAVAGMMKPRGPERGQTATGPAAAPGLGFSFRPLEKRYGDQVPSAAAITAVTAKEIQGA